MTDSPAFNLFALGHCPSCQQQLNQQELVEYKANQNTLSNTYIVLECVCHTCSIAYDCVWSLESREQKHIPTVVKRFANSCQT